MKLARSVRLGLSHTILSQILRASLSSELRRSGLYVVAVAVARPPKYPADMAYLTSTSSLSYYLGYHCFCGSCGMLADRPPLIVVSHQSRERGQQRLVKVCYIGAGGSIEVLMCLSKYLGIPFVAKIYFVRESKGSNPVQTPADDPALQSTSSNANRIVEGSIAS